MKFNYECNHSYILYEWAKITDTCLITVTLLVLSVSLIQNIRWKAPKLIIAILIMLAL